MAMAGIGVDMLEIERMERVLARRPNFARRVFTEEERAYCEKCARPAEHYAARFAAREAVVKALGTGFSDGVSFRDVSGARRLRKAARHPVRSRRRCCPGARDSRDRALDIAHP